MTRVIAISDSDSYLKWSVATLRALPSSWSSTQLVVKNPVLPSPEQARAAAGRSVPVLSYSALMRVLRRATPDVVLLAASGPVVAVLTAAPPLRAADRPVLVTGLPGISVPATPRAITLRTGCDLFVLHSHREVAEFAELADELAMPATFGLASLPYLSRRPEDADVPPPGTVCRTELLFAAQAKVPPARADREPILLALAETGVGGGQAARARHRAADPPRTWPYPQLYADLVRQGRVARPASGSRPGPWARRWTRPAAWPRCPRQRRWRRWPPAAGAGPARLRGLPEMINTVFEGSGCLGALDRPDRRPSVSRGSGLDGRKLLPPRSRGRPG